MDGGLKVWDKGCGSLGNRKDKTERWPCPSSCQVHTYAHTDSHRRHFQKPVICTQLPVAHSDFTAQKTRGGKLIISGPQNSPLWMSQSLNGSQISKLSPTDSLWMQNTIVSRGQGSPVCGFHFLPWPFSFGIEDHVTQMLAHNTSLALETGRWSWFRSYNWLHYGAETKKKKKPWISGLPLPGDLGRIWENLRWVQIWSPTSPIWFNME